MLDAYPMGAYQSNVGWWVDKRCWRPNWFASLMHKKFQLSDLTRIGSSREASRRETTSAHETNWKCHQSRDSSVISSKGNRWWGKLIESEGWVSQVCFCVYWSFSVSHLRFCIAILSLFKPVVRLFVNSHRWPCLSPPCPRVMFSSWPSSWSKQKTLECSRLLWLRWMKILLRTSCPARLGRK